MPRKITKFISLLLCLCLIGQQVGFAQALPAPQAAVFSQPPLLRYLSVNSANPFNYFNFLMDKGLSSVEQGLSPKGTVPKVSNLNSEAKKLIDYFFLGITLPSESFWVNLRPDEPGRITSDDLAKTDLGRTLLEQDLQLKRDVAKLIHPNNPKGKEFWEALYAAIGKDKVKKAEITTSNRVWIVPDEAIVVETEDGAFVASAKLKVMLENDYIKAQQGLSPVEQGLSPSKLKGTVLKGTVPKKEDLNTQLLSEKLMREIILPPLTEEINNGLTYAPLRQIYQSLILAEWFKRKSAQKGLSPSESRGLSPQGTDPKVSLKGTVPNPYSHCINKGFTKGLESELPWSKQAIWQEYIKSYQNGEYKLEDTLFGLKRMYFSGGIAIFGQFAERSGASPIKVINEEEFRKNNELLNNLKFRNTQQAIIEIKNKAIVEENKVSTADINIISIGPEKLEEASSPTVPPGLSAGEQGKSVLGASSNQEELSPQGAAPGDIEFSGSPLINKFIAGVLFSFWISTFPVAGWANPDEPEILQWLRATHNNYVATFVNNKLDEVYILPQKESMWEGSKINQRFVSGVGEKFSEDESDAWSKANKEQLKKINTMSLGDLLKYYQESQLSYYEKGYVSFSQFLYQNHELAAKIAEYDLQAFLNIAIDNPGYMGEPAFIASDLYNDYPGLANTIVNEVLDHGGEGISKFLKSLNYLINLGDIPIAEDILHRTDGANAIMDYLKKLYGENWLEMQMQTQKIKPLAGSPLSEKAQSASSALDGKGKKYFSDLSKDIHLRWAMWKFSKGGYYQDKMASYSSFLLPSLIATVIVPALLMPTATTRSIDELKVLSLEGDSASIVVLKSFAEGGDSFAVSALIGVAERGNVPRKISESILKSIDPAALKKKAEQGDPNSVSALKELSFWDNRSAKIALREIDPAALKKKAEQGDPNSVSALKELYYRYNQPAKEALRTINPAVFKKKAEAGDSNSVSALKELYYRDNQPIKEALTTLNPAAFKARAEHGEFEAVVSLRDLRDQNNSSAKEALTTLNPAAFKKKAEQGDSEVAYLLSELDRFAGNSSAKDALRTLNPAVFKEKAEQGDSHATHTLGMLTFYNNSIAFNISVDLCKKGNPSAVFALVEYRYDNLSIQKALNTLDVGIFKKKAEQGDSSSVSALSKLARYGENSSAKDALRTLNPAALKKKAEQGDSDVYDLEMLFHHGNTTAFDALVDLSVQGNKSARNQLLYIVVGINRLHNSPDAVRFASVNNTTAKQLYSLMAYAQEEIFTSSFNGLFDRMLKRMHTDNINGVQLLENVKYANFRVFVRLCVEYDRINDFLKTVNEKERALLLKKFVQGIEKEQDMLSNAAAVAETFGILKDTEILKVLQETVKAEYQRLQVEHNDKGKAIYGLLAGIFGKKTVIDEAWFKDISSRYNLPDFLTVSAAELFDKNGNHTQRHFFYNDEDGKSSFNNSLSYYQKDRNWDIKDKGTYIIISRTSANKTIRLFANKPDKESEGQGEISRALKELGLKPQADVHRGHSYHVSTTIKYIENDTAIVYLGSCGGYRVVADVLNISPKTHIISTKGTGTKFVNDPVLKRLNEEIFDMGSYISWPEFSKNNEKLLGQNQAFERYVFPHENLSILFIKAFNQYSSAGSPLNKPASSAMKSTGTSSYRSMLKLTGIPKSIAIGILGSTPKEQFKKMTKGIYPQKPLKHMKVDGYNPIIIGYDHEGIGDLSKVQKIFKAIRNANPKKTIKVALEIIPPIQLQWLKEFVSDEREYKKNETIKGQTPDAKTVTNLLAYRAKIKGNGHFSENIGLWLLDEGFELIVIDHDDVEKWIGEDSIKEEEIESFGFTRPSLKRPAFTAIRRDIYGIELVDRERPDVISVGSAHALKYDLLLERDGSRSFYYFGWPFRWSNVLNLWDEAHSSYLEEKGVRDRSLSSESPVDKAQSASSAMEKVEQVAEGNIIHYLRTIAGKLLNPSKSYRELPLRANNKLYRGLIEKSPEDVVDIIHKGVRSQTEVSEAKGILQEFLNKQGFSQIDLEKKTFKDLLEEFDKIIGEQDWAKRGFWRSFSRGEGIDEGGLGDIVNVIIEKLNLYSGLERPKDVKSLQEYHAKTGIIYNSVFERIKKIVGAIQSLSANSKIGKEFAGDDPKVEGIENQLLIEIDQSKLPESALIDLRDIALHTREEEIAIIGDIPPEAVIRMWFNGYEIQSVSSAMEWGNFKNQLGSVIPDKVLFDGLLEKVDKSYLTYQNPVVDEALMKGRLFIKALYESLYSPGATEGEISYIVTHYDYKPGKYRQLEQELGREFLESFRNDYFPMTRYGNNLNNLRYEEILKAARDLIETKNKYNEFFEKNKLVQSVPESPLKKEVQSASSAIEEKGGIDLSKIELTLKDESYISSLNPADIKVLRAAKALKDQWDSLSLLYVHEIMILMKDGIIKDIQNKELLENVLQQLQIKSFLDPQAVQFLNLIQSQKPISEIKLTLAK